MHHAPAPRPFGDDAYEEIERAVMETTRGRWFLAEFARRIRSAETREVLETLGRMEGLLLKPQARDLPPPLPRAVSDAPVDAMMQRLQSAISAMSGTAPTVSDTRQPDASQPDARQPDAPEQAGPAANPAPETLAALDAMSPADRLKLFY